MNTKKMTREMLAKTIIEKFAKQYGMNCYVNIRSERMDWEDKPSKKLYLDGDCLSELQSNGILGYKMVDYVTEELAKNGYFFEWQTYSIMSIYDN